MIDEKIIVTEEIKELILGARKAGKITARELSIRMERSAYWLSNIENGRTKSIMKSELVELLKICKGITEETAEQEIEKALTEFTHHVELEDIRGGTENTEKQGTNFILYGETARLEDISKQREEFDRYTRKIISGLCYFFDQINDKKAVVRVVRRIYQNMRADLGFMVSLESLPWCRISSLSTEERQKLFNQIRDVLLSTGSCDGCQSRHHSEKCDN